MIEKDIRGLPVVVDRFNIPAWHESYTEASVVAELPKSVGMPTIKFAVLAIASFFKHS